jgi:uncharacterized protein
MLTGSDMTLQADELPIFDTTEPISQLLLKVAARCNIDCSYCYWFRDASVYKKPKLMSRAVLDQFLVRLEEQITRHGLKDFLVMPHGGEPLLWGVANFRLLAERCAEISARTGCAIAIATTTNGLLINDAWLDCFQEHDITAAISIDGPAHIHDMNRRTFKGGGTHAGVMRAVAMMKARGIKVNVLSVANPAHPAKDVFDFFAEAGITKYDLLLPDATVDDKPASIAPFYKELFNLWLEANRDKQTVNIRTIVDMVMGLLGGDSGTEGTGYRPMELCTVMTDGSVEVHDVLRIAGNGSTTTSFNIFDNGFEDIKADPQWLAAREASLNLPQKCRECPFVLACGGGYLPHRYSKANGYHNPSAYCADLYALFDYMQDALVQQLYVSQPTGERLNIGEAMALAAPAMVAPARQAPSAELQTV